MAETAGAPFGERDEQQPETRRAYQPPVLERLGKWQALTLQMSVPVGPGGLLLDPESRRLA